MTNEAIFLSSSTTSMRMRQHSIPAPLFCSPIISLPWRSDSLSLPRGISTAKRKILLETTSRGEIPPIFVRLWPPCPRGAPPPPTPPPRGGGGGAGGGGGGGGSWAYLLLRL